MTDASVRLWGRQIGAVTWVKDRGIGVFQYAPEFINSNVEVAPMMMPLQETPYEFAALSRPTFKGLPGMLADSLPDKFGNALIDAWLAREGRTPESFNPVERLCYIGARGIGALEFEPAILGTPSNQKKIEVASLVGLANRILDDRINLRGKFSGDDDARAIEDIIRVGASAGGARAKAILAWNAETGEFRSGQLPAEEGFTPWLMKFDGVAGNTDKELADPMGYGQIEYAYSQMALSAGIDMTLCRLHHEGGRAHFMTRRFDRSATGEKLHMQSLGAMMHFDFNQAGAYSYEQAIQTIRHLKLPSQDIEQQYRRAVFNVVARNQDDHVKNIAFLMNKKGEWRLSPAFDVAYSFNPDGEWTGSHQMSINGKRDGFDLDDLLQLGKMGDLKTARCRDIINEIQSAVGKWRQIATAAGVKEKAADKIEKTFRNFGTREHF